VYSGEWCPHAQRATSRTPARQAVAPPQVAGPANSHDGVQESDVPAMDSMTSGSGARIRQNTMAPTERGQVRQKIARFYTKVPASPPRDGQRIDAARRPFRRAFAATAAATGRRGGCLAPRFPAFVASRLPPTAHLSNMRIMYEEAIRRSTHPQ